MIASTEKLGLQAETDYLHFNITGPAGVRRKEASNSGVFCMLNSSRSYARTNKLRVSERYCKNNAQPILFKFERISPTMIYTNVSS